MAVKNLKFRSIKNLSKPICPCMKETIPFLSIVCLFLHHTVGGTSSFTTVCRVVCQLQTKTRHRRRALPFHQIFYAILLCGILVFVLENRPISLTRLCNCFGIELALFPLSSATMCGLFLFLCTEAQEQNADFLAICPCKCMHIFMPSCILFGGENLSYTTMYFGAVMILPWNKAC